jgi:hypothetical protein
MSDKPIMELEFEDVLPTSPGGFCCLGCSSLVGFVLVILFFPCTVTQLGQWRLGLVRNKVTGFVDLANPHTPGRYWIGFWKEFVEFPSNLQTIEFSHENPEEGVRHLSVLKSRDKDGKSIAFDISVQYRLSLENIGRIYEDMLIYYEDIYIAELRDAFAKAANLFAIAEIWENYTSVVEKMNDRCVSILSTRHAECWGIQVWGVTLSPEYETKVILTQVRKQAAKTETARKDQIEIRAQTKVLEEEYQKNITITRSGGIAEVYNIEREAYATAQANYVSAQAKALVLVKNIVCPAYTKNTDGNCSTAPWVMTPTQLVKYQKMVLLKALNESQLIYNMRGGIHPEAMNVEASRNIMNGKVRRLLDSRRPQKSRRLLESQSQLQEPHNTLQPPETLSGERSFNEALTPEPLDSDPLAREL